MQENEVQTLRNQLTIARNEINKLRTQVRNLQHVQRKDIEGISNLLSNFRCEGCRKAAEENTQNRNEIVNQQNNDIQNSCNVESSAVCYRSIGVIRTDFPEKRAVPRQSSVGGRLRSRVELNNDTFTNPEHALEGLDEFSHLWLIYHFHRNNSHPKAKVAPPRLGGERVGVFSTRSPHRPCQIGLSLVEIERIDGAIITFFGTDMVDGTPVLDIKPYIPFYDSPTTIDAGRLSIGPNETIDFYNSRQEPDGEESDLEMFGAGAIGGGVGGNVGNGSSSATNGICSNNSNNVNHQNSCNFINNTTTSTNIVKIPNWVVAEHRLKVCFNEHAENQLQELQIQRDCIVDILEADPRSVYLRTKHGSQIFTFQLSEVTVTCKFDDKAGTVTVVQVRRTENVQDDDMNEH